MPSFANAVASGASTPAKGKFRLRPRKKRPLSSGSSIVSAGVSDDKAPLTPFSRKKSLGESSNMAPISHDTESS